MTVARFPVWSRVVLSVMALLGVVILVGWFWWVPRWRPPLRDGEVYGVDVSAHQREIDWDRVASDGMAFAYIKATEGGDFVDALFEANWRGAGQAGLQRGAYHFFTLCTAGRDQAKNFLTVASPESDALPPAVDLELDGNCRARPPASEVNAELSAFLTAVEEAWGVDAVLYVGNDWEDHYPVLERLGRRLWHQRFLLRPDVDAWWIWQLHGYARVRGVAGQVDLNVMRSGA